MVFDHTTRNPCCVYTAYEKTQRIAPLPLSYSGITQLLSYTPFETNVFAYSMLLLHLLDMAAEEATAFHV
jgi:hypothetical protein